MGYVKRLWRIDETLFEAFRVIVFGGGKNCMQSQRFGQILDILATLYVDHSEWSGEQKETRVCVLNRELVRCQYSECRLFKNNVLKGVG